MINEITPPQFNPKRRGAGERLRRMRMRLGLTTRKVAELSEQISAQQKEEAYLISHARLVQIENEESVPGIHKLFTLGAIYGVSVAKLLEAYLDVDSASALHSAMRHANTHLLCFDEGGLNEAAAVQANSNHPLTCTGFLPNRNERANRAHATGRAMLSSVHPGNRPNVRYGIIGLADRTMYPLIPPGSIVQLAECRRPMPRVEYQAEIDRPIYFLELHTGYICSWCELVDEHVLSIPHPLSGCPTRRFTYPSEAEIVGRVTAVAMRLAGRANGDNRADGNGAARSSVTGRVFASGTGRSGEETSAGS
jgi:transcriptional regulator with XRE-family HTH domain